MDIAVLGMGRMGRALAGRLLEGGHRVTVWNRTKGKAGELVAAGAPHEAPGPGASPWPSGRAREAGGGADPRNGGEGGIPSPAHRDAGRAGAFRGRPAASRWATPPRGP